RIARLMVDREWGSTMVLTEPDAGSDVGAGRTTAGALRRRSARLAQNVTGSSGQASPITLAAVADSYTGGL
ncbi:hypothetical protein ACWEO1_39420, partial [Kitasatospora cineracea]